MSNPLHFDLDLTTDDGTTWGIGADADEGGWSLNLGSLTDAEEVAPTEETSPARPAAFEVAKKYALPVGAALLLVLVAAFATKGGRS